MKSRYIKWKIMFFLVLLLGIYSIFEAITVPEIIAPTHLPILSYSLLFFDFMILLGIYNYAFRKKIINIKIVWEILILLFYVVNILAVGFEFYNRFDGYEVDEMVQIAILKIFIVVFMSYPAYLYCKHDLSKLN